MDYTTQDYKGAHGSIQEFLGNILGRKKGVLAQFLKDYGEKEKGDE